MPTRMLASASPLALWVLALVAMLFFLRTAKQLLIPIALAVLISYALEPAVGWLSRHRLPRTLSSALVLIVILAGVGAAVYGLRHQAFQLLDGLPEAIHRTREVVLSQLGIDADAIQQATQALGTNTSSESAASGTAPATPAPMMGSLVQRAASAILLWAGDLVIIVFLVFFLLISGSQVKQRLIDIAGSNAQRRQLTARVIDDINAQIQRYLLVLLLTSAIVGVATGLILAWIGIQHAAIWGLLAGIFNSIPYFGPVILSGGLFIIGIVEEGSLDAALRMSGAALVITSIEGWLLTPALMGRAERMNALAVFLGLLLWTWLWGVWGTVLAVPMLVIVKSVADQVESLRPLGRLMAR